LGEWEDLQQTAAALRVTESAGFASYKDAYKSGSELLPDFGLDEILAHSRREVGALTPARSSPSLCPSRVRR
jgi:hypothetical protein